MKAGFILQERSIRPGGILKYGTMVITETKGVSQWQIGGVTVANGVVKWFNDRKGYGFIEQEDGSDVFVHHTGIDASGFRSLNEGDQVTFEIEEGPKGAHAVNVKVV